MPNIEQLLSESRLAFLNQQNEMALNLANQAIALDEKNPEGYRCAANAMMSMGRYDDAIKNYRFALKYDPANGNRYYELGFALATNEKLADAMKYLAKADELGCIPENLVQLYNLLGIICFDIGRYDDAIVNLEKAEQLTGVNLEIMQRKAIIYGIRNEVRKGLQIANQIKMVAPSEYQGYQLAFKLLVQAKRLDTAATELKKAARYAKPTMDYYFDRMTLELEHYKLDKDTTRFHKALEIIQEALKSVAPDMMNVMDSYINAAELYLQLEMPEMTLKCLSAAQAPAEAYNNGFEIIETEIPEPYELDEADLEIIRQQDELKMQEAYGEDGMALMFESAEPNEEGELDFMTTLDGEEELEEMTDSFKLEEPADFRIPEEKRNQITRLYIGAYTLSENYEKVIEYARVMQGAEGIQNTHVGKYAEANAYLKMGAPDAADRYADAIKFFRNAMIKDPSDLLAVTMRVQCCVDIGQYDEAERVCMLLAREAREPLMEKIKEARAGGM